MAVDRTGCIGNTIKVASGHYIDVSDPDPKDIDLFSIASALSKICRFGGHCPVFYSVAEHCVLAVALAAQDDSSLEFMRALLLHDATEAYLGDMVKPLKNIMPQYREVEDRMEKAIATHFSLDFERYHSGIKSYDRMMLKAEKNALWPTSTEKWTGWDMIEDREVHFAFSEPLAAQERFLGVASSLGF